MTTFVVSGTSPSKAYSLEAFNKLGSTNQNKVTIKPTNPRDWVKNIPYKPMCFLHKYIIGLGIPFLGMPGHLLSHFNAFPIYLLMILKNLIEFRVGTSQPPKQHTKESNRKPFFKSKMP